MYMNTHPKIQNILDTLPTFISEMDADWEMTVDYVMSQIQPTYMEWVEIGKVFDDTLDWQLSEYYCYSPPNCSIIVIHTTLTPMRKIEIQMCQAIQSNKNWKSGNTEVVTNDTVSNVYLHGNLIATVTDTDMTIFDGGWQSNTTKSRLNALCQEFCISGEGVFQKNFLWYVRKFVGKINGQNVFKTEDFVSGYLFAWYDSDLI